MFFWHGYWSWSFIFQLLMLIHFFRRRPEGYWFFVILFLGPLGAAVYFVIEVIPDLRVKPPVIRRFERKRRRQWLEQLVVDSPSHEALTGLAEIHAIEGRHSEAIDLFGRALQLDPEDPESLYGRGCSYLETEQVANAIADLERVVQADPSYSIYGAHLSLAEAYEATDRVDEALHAYEAILGRTTVSRAYFNYGRLLAQRGEIEKARQMMEEILAKKATLPRYLRRQERPWFRRAKAFLKETG